ncbi:hypothetical protein L6164_022394 [Bauhinia variegata]|uniref:Uncharacterized protein n=1 Tax=Bauhinia variegata TaxID=167791 RepID=A0ACB9MGI6_BAUVA|nr:hypothetical protein L6164_022394 [Bauhinia variegata]
MQQAIPYISWRPLHSPSPTTHFSPQSFVAQTAGSSPSAPSKGLAKGAKDEMVLNMISENAVIVFAKRGCCMSHVVKRLLLGLGVNPAVYEVDEKDEVGVVRGLEAIVDAGEKLGKVQFPTIFIGGRLFGGLDRLMATHISGELVPILKEARALWL